MSRGRRIVLVFLVVGVVMLVGTYFGFRALQQPPLRDRFPLIKVGMTESEVRGILGDPYDEHRSVRTTGQLRLFYEEGRMNYGVLLQDGRVTDLASGAS